MAGEVDSSGGYTTMLVKFNAVPPNMNQIRVDSIVRLRAAEVRTAWRRPDTGEVRCHKAQASWEGV